MGDAAAGVSPPEEVPVPPLPGQPEAPLRLWHKQDDLFSLPRTAVKVLLLSPTTHGHPFGPQLCRLWCDAVADALRDQAYMASEARLTLSVYNGGSR
jgi:secreted Zn-dependent insulinase-like peptidase